VSAADPIVVVGDALLDRDVHGDVDRLAPDAPVPVLEERRVAVRPGGAALAAALIALDGRPVKLVTAIGDDPAGRELAGVLNGFGVEVVDVGLTGATPEKVRLVVDARVLLRIDRGGDGGPAPASAAARAAIGWASALLIADYGRGVAADQDIRAALAALPPDVPVVWDPHPRGPAPVAGVALATPNDAEAGMFDEGPTSGADEAHALRAGRLCERWQAHNVCVTCGARGAVLAAAGGGPIKIPAPPVTQADPCGAGDRFAARAAEALADGADVREAVFQAVTAASEFVARGGAGAALQAGRSAGAPGADRVSAVRAAGGTVVATGGCFDLLHVGHLRTLQAARELGDCLVVCLNSDESVRRLKGPGRPVVAEAERAAMLQGLECVDRVEIFTEDTPAAVLEKIRPDVWAKGGDYRIADLPEARVIAGWGGRIAVLPYVDGRSTTALIEEVHLHAAG
jgi:rfaE bifunctional protein nucleotidyltransferase chain/domain/rfaE bifunctional protein kinase chain/domain